MRIHIEYSAELPEIEGATEDDLNDFISYSVEGGSITGDNPYIQAGCSIDPQSFSLHWEER